VIPRRFSPKAIDDARRALVYLAVLAVLVWTLFPLFWMLLISLKPPADQFVMPPKFLFIPMIGNYVTAVTDPSFIKSLTNSLVISLSATLASLAIAAPAGYSLARFSFKGRSTMAYLILVTSMTPILGLLLPFFVMFVELGLYDTQVSVIIVYLMLRLALATWMVMSFVQDLPKELEEAAFIDGCSWFTTFRLIVLPLIAPGLAATAIIGFIFCWNEFATAFILTGTNAQTATVMLFKYMGREFTAWGPLTATGILILLPVEIFALAVQRYLIRGLTFGAVKG
jgi:multiple sugar transport system permease protein